MSTGIEATAQPAPPSTSVAELFANATKAIQRCGLREDANFSYFVDLANLGQIVEGTRSAEAANRLALVLLDEAQHLPPAAFKGMLHFASKAHSDPEFAASLLADGVSIHRTLIGT